MTKQILIADDHFVVRMGTAIILEDFFENFFIDHAENYQEVIEKVSEKKYDLLILDVEMPGSIFENMITEIKKIDSNIKILIFTGHMENQAIRFLSKGAEAYLNKSSEEKKIIEAVAAIFSTGYYYPQEILHDFINVQSCRGNIYDKPLDILSEREKEIYNYLIKGYGILEISNALNLHMSTISTHKKRVLKKLDVSSIAELVHLHHKHYSE